MASRAREVIDCEVAGRETFGWDIGGAHLKACRLQGGRVMDIVQWPCRLWLGLDTLDAALAATRARWPSIASPHAAHAVTMTGEMVDLFGSREQGVHQLVGHFAAVVGADAPAASATRLRCFAGSAVEGAVWVRPDQVALHWRAIASANWLATAQWLAGRLPAAAQDALLVDIGSTTTDIIPLRAGRVAACGLSDAERLATGELVYHGVVRTPLCALGPRVTFEGRTVNVMNEFFATSGDVYRLTGELDPAHDQQASADGAPKDLPATRQRLARMIGRDAGDAPDAAWRQLAAQWREAQLSEWSGQIRRVLDASGLRPDAPWVAAGCGDFLVPELARRADCACIDFSRQALPWHPNAPPDAARWAQVCAPAVAVALLASDGAGPALRGPQYAGVGSAA